ncbi:MAG: hypothetical protein K9M99_10715 [Candidatus Cloacimonetes bacterium]|nr:hypothetical protein [Candidatus Cloacimonadota bacterium]
MSGVYVPQRPPYITAVSAANLLIDIPFSKNLTQMNDLHWGKSKKLGLCNIKSGEKSDRQWLKCYLLIKKAVTLWSQIISLVYYANYECVMGLL